MNTTTWEKRFQYILHQCLQKPLEVIQVELARSKDRKLFSLNVLIGDKNFSEVGDWVNLFPAKVEMLGAIIHSFSDIDQIHPYDGQEPSREF